MQQERGDQVHDNGEPLLHPSSGMERRGRRRCDGCAGEG